MALTVGTDAYVAVTDVAAYVSMLDIASDWSDAPEPRKEAAVREATAFLDNSFQWRGYLLDRDQPLGWPRVGACDREGRNQEGIPTYVRNATCELALLAVKGRLAPISRPDGGGKLKKVVVGDLSEEYFESGATPGDYDYIRIMLRGLGVFRSVASGQVSLVRT